MPLLCVWGCIAFMIGWEPWEHIAGWHKIFFCLEHFFFLKKILRHLNETQSLLNVSGAGRPQPVWRVSLSSEVLATQSQFFASTAWQVAGLEMAKGLFNPLWVVSCWRTAATEEGRCCRTIAIASWRCQFINSPEVGPTSQLAKSAACMMWRDVHQQWVVRSYPTAGNHEGYPIRGTVGIFGLPGWEWKGATGGHDEPNFLNRRATAVLILFHFMLA